MTHNVEYPRVCKVFVDKWPERRICVLDRFLVADNQELFLLFRCGHSPRYTSRADVSESGEKKPSDLASAVINVRETEGIGTHEFFQAERRIPGVIVMKRLALVQLIEGSNDIRLMRQIYVRVCVNQLSK